MEQLTSLASAWAIGFAVTVVVTTGLTIYGWRRRQPVFVHPRWSLISPFVKVTWESRRFGDWVWLLKALCNGCVLGATYPFLQRWLWIAGAIGVLTGLLLPALGNTVIGILDRYEIVPRDRPAARADSRDLEPAATASQSDPGWRAG